MNPSEGAFEPHNESPRHPQPAKRHHTRLAYPLLALLGLAAIGCAGGARKRGVQAEAAGSASEAVTPAAKPKAPDVALGSALELPAGIFALGPVTRSRSLALDASAECRSGVEVARADGAVLCRGAGDGGVMTSTWQSPSVTGAYIRLSWNEVNPAPGVYDFSVLDREMDQAVAHHKRFGFSFQAGKRGTPEWIFDRGVQALRLRDGGSKAPEGQCGAWMVLGSPTDAAFQKHYFALLSAAAEHIKSRSDWYRALAYVKPSGANLYTHENRLPKRCASDQGCPCNTQILAEAGYTPSGLESFYRKQLQQLAADLPGKAMVYALIQDGFPKVNDQGGYMMADGSSSDGRRLPRAFEQTQSVLDLGQALYPQRFVVQHNGLQLAPADGTCPNQGMHPVPLEPMRWYGRPGSGCPNRWVLREGAQGMATALQTTNGRGVGSSADLEAALENGWANSDALFVEVYEERIWEADRQRGGVLDAAASGRTLAQWKALFESRRP